MGEVTPIGPGDSKEAREEAARIARAQFLAQVAGAKLRSEQLPKDLLKVVAPAVANWSLIQILNGKVPIRNAGEAAAVAKVAAEIGRLELGESTMAEPTTAAERQQKINEMKMLLEAVQQRRAILEDQAAGIATPGETDDAGDAPVEQAG